MSDVKQTLKQRGDKYGKFSQHADIAQELKAVFYTGVIKSGKEESEVPNYIWESVDLICHKLARIANGDPLYVENFRDIAGYAQLVVNELMNTEGATDAKIISMVRSHDGWGES